MTALAPRLRPRRRFEPPAPRFRSYFSIFTVKLRRRTRVRIGLKLIRLAGHVTSGGPSSRSSAAYTDARPKLAGSRTSTRRTDRLVSRQYK